jgi:ribonuclease E
LKQTGAERRILIDVGGNGLARIAVIEDNTLQEYYSEQSNSIGGTLGNIYKGKVNNVEPTLNAIFVDIGLTKNGFLPFSKVVVPQHRLKDKKIDIGRFFKREDEIIVQITREGSVEKGPLLSMDITLLGRFFVLMPMQKTVSTSEKFVNKNKRRCLTEILKKIKSEAIGVAIRSCVKYYTTSELESDINNLVSIWKDIISKSRRYCAPSVLYKEPRLPLKIIRDRFTKNTLDVIVNDTETYKQLASFFEKIMPVYKTRVRFYGESIGLFEKFGIEKDVKVLDQRKVVLPSGVSIEIEPTEALTAIDVNSGSATEGISQEGSVLKINIESAREIMRQIRLRDIGGLIVINYIAMKRKQHRDALFSCMKQESLKDSKEIIILPMSRLSLVEMARRKTSN